MRILGQPSQLLLVAFLYFMAVLPDIDISAILSDETVPALVGQVVFASATYGFLITSDSDERRVFWHQRDCLKDAPTVGDLVSFRLAPPRRANESPRAKEIRILAKAEKKGL
jgi:hypothetical protein